MKKYFNFLMFAMMIATLCLTACSDDEEEGPIVGIWEVVSVNTESSYNISSGVKVGEKLYINADGTFDDSYDKGRWTMNGNKITFTAYGSYTIPAVFEVCKVTKKELVLKMNYGILTATITYKRLL